jgi:hypothetical protein
MRKKIDSIGKTLYLVVLLSTLFLTAGNTVYGQCNYNEGASPSFTIAGNTTDEGYNTVVIATDLTGEIRYLSAPGTTKLNTLAAGKYDVYSFNYQDDAPTTLAVGNNIAELTTLDDCVALSQPVRIGVCKCTDELATAGSVNVTAVNTGQTVSAGYTHQYVLLDASGKIKEIKNTGSFSFTEANSYTLYSLNYQTAKGITGLSIGSNWSGVTGDCFSLSNPLDINVCPLGALPVALIGFDVKKEGNIAVLKWSTVSEVNSDHFEIQRSTNGKNWKEIGRLASSGESKSILTYTFFDTEPRTGENFYRLRMVDKDESFAYSRIKSVNFEKQMQYFAYPNPVAETLNLNILDWQQVDIIEIRNQKGESVYRSNNKHTKTIDVKKLKQGLYILKIIQKDGQIFTQTLIRN